jgi:hypothetical protein
MSLRFIEMLHPHFSPDITLGHLLQAAVVLVTGGGGILGGYLSLRSDVDTQRAEYRVALAAREARSPRPSASSTIAAARTASSSRRCAPRSSA